MAGVEPSARQAAHAAAAAFGGTADVARYYDESEANAVDIVSCGDRPVPGFSCYSTVDLHRSANLLGSKDIRVELAGVAEASLSRFPNLLATAAFYVMKNQWLCAPGVVFPSLVGEYELSEHLEHVVWVHPFPWDELAGVEISNELTIHWLLAVPISDSERRFLEDAGYDSFEQLFSEQEVDYYDLCRAPVV